MTIDKAIKQIIECKAYKQCDTEKDSEAFEFAVDTMRKYQKIQEIIKDWENGRFSDGVGCLKVKVVLDGNDD